MQKRLSISYLFVITSLVAFLLSVAFAAGSFDESGNTKSVTTGVCLNLAMTFGFLIVAQLLRLIFPLRWLFVVVFSTVVFLIYSVYRTHFYPATELPINFGTVVGAIISYSILFLIGEVVSAFLIRLCSNFAKTEDVR